MKRLLAGVVSTACACALIVRVTRLVRACRSDVVEYRVVEFAQQVLGFGGPPESWAYTPEVHRYVVVGGQAFREIYRHRDPFLRFFLDDASISGYGISPKPERFHKHPEWLEVVRMLRVRIAKGERPDLFLAVERVQQ